MPDNLPVEVITADDNKSIFSKFTGFFKTAWSELEAKDLLHFGWMAALTAALGYGVMSSKAPEPPGPAPTPLPPISLPAKHTGQTGHMVKLSATTDGTDVQWWTDEKSDVAFARTSSKSAVFTGKAGSYTVLAYTALKGTDGVWRPTPPAATTVVISDPTPPTPPIPPGPTPVPPSPTPLPGEGLRVLILYDKSKLPSYPAAQVTIFTSADVIAYLNSKCTADTDGKTKMWRIWDASTDTTSESAFWQGAVKLPHASLPWIIIGNGKQGTSEALPATVADTLTLLKKFGG